MSILMCKNVPVYDIDNHKVLCNNLLPGYMQVYSQDRNAFKTWLKLRYSSNTNSLARQLKGITFGQGNRVTINRETHAFGLSDCYWIKESNDTHTFEQLSPYYVDFWKGTGVYMGGAIPTLYVPGYISKQWINSSILCKYGSETFIEAECSRVCRLCGIQAARVEIDKANNCVQVYNITSDRVMLEQADQSGRVDPDEFDEETIVGLFGFKGMQMIIMDAIFGNGDRHAGNFGWLRDSNTGAYLDMAPLYDFDHALDSKAERDRLITDAVKTILRHPEYRDEAIRIATIVVKVNTINIFRVRANTVLNSIIT